MHELLAILEGIASARRAHQECLLATLVRVDGSAFRRPGARMLILPPGQIIGAITGGCVEKEVLRAAQRMPVLQTATLLTFDMRPDDDALVGYGSGCKSLLHVLLERINPKNEPAFIDFLRDSLHVPGSMATVFQVQGKLPLQPGARLMIRGEQWDLAGAWPTDLAMRAAQAAMENGPSGRQVTLESADGRVDLMIETILPPPHIFIFGDSPTGAAVKRFADELGWLTTLAEARASELSAAADQVAAHAGNGARIAAVILTHRYVEDLDLLRRLTRIPLSYLGILGSRQRIARLCGELGDLPPPALADLHGPIGLDIGAGNPAEIALSIVAEIQAVLAGRTGGPLKDRRSPIHSEPHAICEEPR